MVQATFSGTPDVLIVGGGPAGLATALALRQRGASVTVVDARTPPIDKACGEGLMPDSIADLARLGLNLTTSAGVEFQGIRFVNQSGRQSQTCTATANFPAHFGSGRGIKRQVLHTCLTEAAADAGVNLQWGTAVQFRGKVDKGEVSVSGRPTRFGWLIGADGQSSAVRRWASLEQGSKTSQRFGFRQHFSIAPWSEFVEVHWGQSGQAYVTPISENEVCIAGVVRDPHCRLANLLYELPALQAKLGSSPANNSERGSVTTTRKFSSVAKGRIALVGDASGSADAITGEGLGLSFRQAVLLADCIEAGDLAHYNQMHPQSLKLSHQMARVLLWMDRSELLRGRAIRMLASRPDIFTSLLGVHLGKETIQRFALTKGFEVARQLLSPKFLLPRSDLQPS